MLTIKLFVLHCFILCCLLVKGTSLLTLKDFNSFGGTESNGVISIPNGYIQSKKTYQRPITVEAEMRSSKHTECIDMTLFAANHEKNTEISMEIGAWDTKWRFFPGDSRGEMGPVKSFRKVKLELDANTEVKFYIDGDLKYTTNSNLKSGYLRFIRGCIDMEVRNIKIIPSSPSPITQPQPTPPQPTQPQSPPPRLTQPQPTPPPPTQPQSPPPRLTQPQPTPPPPTQPPSPPPRLTQPQPQTPITTQTPQILKLFDIEISNGISNKRIIENGYLPTTQGQHDYKILSVVGYKGDGDQASFLPPEECSEIISFSAPGNLFCIDKQSGDIYATQQTTRIYVGGQTYNITIQQTNTTFKEDVKRFTLQVNFHDICESSSKTYIDLQSKRCASYLFVSRPNSVNSGVVTFQGPIRFFGVHKILGFRLSSSLFTNISNKSFDLKVSSMGETKNTKTYRYRFQKTPMDMYIQSYDINEVNGLKIIEVELMSVSGNRLTRIPLGNNVISLFTSRTWSSCTIECVNIYKIWKKSLTKQTQLKCKKDEFFFQTYYGRCTDLNPVFEGAPSQTLSNLITGCRYRALYYLQQFSYLLINGFKRNNEFILPSRKRRAITTNEQLITFSFQAFQIRSYDHVGVVKCAIFDPDRMKAPVLSNSTFIKYRVPIFVYPNTLPPKTQFTAGDTLIIKGCSFTDAMFNFRPGETYWLKDGIPFANATIKGSAFTDLIIKRATPKHTGTYQCAIKPGPFALVTSKSTNITISETSVHFITHPSVQDVKGTLKVKGCLYGIAGSLPSDSSVYYEFIKYSNKTNKTITKIYPQQPARVRRAVSINTIPDINISGFDGFGEYRCVIYDAKIMTEAAYSNKTNTDAFLPQFKGGPIFWINEYDRGIVPAGRSVLLVCKLESSFDLGMNLYWTLGGIEYGRIKTVQNGTKIGVIQEYSNFLLIQKMTLNDSGIFGCTVSIPNLPTIKSRGFKVFVQETKLHFITSPSVQDVGGTLTVKGCKYRHFGILPSDSSFYYEFTKQSNQKNKTITKIVTGIARALTSVPDIKISGFDGFGEYRCVVYDAKVMTEAAYSNKTNTDTFLPRFKERPILSRAISRKGKFLTAGEPLAITCNLESPFDLGTNMYWTLEGIEYGRYRTVRIGKKIGVIQEYRNILQIFMLTLNDAGIFGCTVSIPNLPTIKSQGVKVSVQDFEVVFTSAPTYIDLRITGCNFNMTVELDGGIIDNSTYILFNGTRVNRISISSPGEPTGQRLRKRRDALLQWRFTPLPIQSYSKGFYQCVFYNKTLMKEPVVSKSIFVSVPAPQFQEVVQRNITIEVGKKTELCPCLLRPPFIKPKNGEYYILKDGSNKIPVETSQDSMILSEPDERRSSCLIDSNQPFKGPHVIDKVKFSDEGFYQCVFEPDGLQPVKSAKWYLKVIDFAVIMKINPKLDSSGDSINGCQYIANSDFTGFTYLLLNGSHRLNFTGRETLVANDLYKTPNLPISSYLQKGHFQCVVFDPKRMKKIVLSNSSSFIKLRDPLFKNISSQRSMQIIAQHPFRLAGCSYLVSKNLQISSKEVYWTRNDRRFDTGYMDTNVSSSARQFEDFIRSNISFEDEGEYRCVLNFKGLDSPIRSPPINVTIKDVFVHFSKPEMKLDKNGVLFSGCYFTSNLYLTDYTQKNLVHLAINGHKKIPTSFTQLPDGYKTSSFLIESFDNFGVYRCIASNPQFTRKPTISQNATLKDILYYPNITGNPIPSLDNETVSVETSFRIKGCRFQSTFKKGFDAYWLKDGKRFADAEFQPTNEWFVLVFQDLVFDRLSPENNGTYICVLDLPDNPIQYSTPVSIVLQEFTAAFTSAPQWKISRDKVEVIGCKYHSATNLNNNAYWLLNDSVKIHVTGRKNETTKQGILLENGLFEYQIPALSISSFDKLGNYQCVIENNLLKNNQIISDALNLTSLNVHDVLPTFKQHPTSFYNNKTGGFIRVDGCSISTKVPLEADGLYYMVNAATKYGVKLPRDYLRNKEISFPPFIKKVSDVTDQGFYQCAIKIKGPFAREIFSKSTDIQFEDVAAAGIQFHMDRKWNKQLDDVTSDEFKTLERAVVLELKKKLPLENEKAPMVRVLRFRPGSVISDVQILYPNMTSKERIAQCRSFKSLEKDSTFSQTLNIRTITVKSLDCCPEDTAGEESYKGVVSYIPTLVSSTSVNNCTYHATSSSRRGCTTNLKDGPQWSEANFENCPAKSPVTNKLINLAKVQICSGDLLTDCQTPVEITGNLSEIIDKPEKITTRQDLDFVSDILKTIAIHPTAFQPNDTKSARTVISNILSTVSTFIVTDRKIVTHAQQKTQTSASILKSLDIIAQRLGNIVQKTNKDILIKKENIGFTIVYSKSQYLDVIGSDFDGTLGVHIDRFIDDESNRPTESPLDDIVLASSLVPPEVFKNKSQVVFSFLFRDDTLFQSQEQLKDFFSGRVPFSSVSSSVLAVTVGDEAIENLTNPIYFKFTKKEDRKNVEGQTITNQCMFWNPDAPIPNIKNARGDWFQDGCEKVNETNSYITCRCNHLTNFAIVLDVSQSKSNPLELKIMTWIGCGVSIAGLLLTLLTYIIFKNLRKKLPPKILMSLSISLMILLIVFLVGVERESTGSDEACQVVAGILHYFLLATFCWMLVEAINLYRNFVKIFRGGSDGKFFVKASIFGWGVPLVIVVVNGAVKPENLGNDEFCVVFDYSFYFALLLPVAAILLVNFIVLYLVMRSLTTVSKGSQMAGKRLSIRRQARITMACTTLLGLTWVFALLAVGDLRYTFQLLFTIFNSLQGFFIFIFYVALNMDVRKEWKKFLNMEENNSYGINSHTTSQPHHTLTKNGQLKVKNGEKNDGYEMKEQSNTTEEIDLSSSTGHLMKMKNR